MRNTALTPSLQRLVRLMQKVNFGRIENLRIHQSVPAWDPPPRLVREIKFGGDNEARPEAKAESFALKAAVTEMVDQFDQVGSGMIAVLEIKHGLPFRMIVEEDAA